MAGVSRRSATGSRSSEGSILTRRDAPPNFLASAIIRAMDAFMRIADKALPHVQVVQMETPVGVIPARVHHDFSAFWIASR